MRELEYAHQQEGIKAAKERETLRLRAMQEKMADKQVRPPPPHTHPPPPPHTRPHPPPSALRPPSYGSNSHTPRPTTHDPLTAPLTAPAEQALHKADQRYAEQRFEEAHALLLTQLGVGGAEIQWRLARICKELAQVAGGTNPNPTPNLTLTLTLALTLTLTRSRGARAAPRARRRSASCCSRGCGTPPPRSRPTTRTSRRTSGTPPTS